MAQLSAMKQNIAACFACVYPDAPTARVLYGTGIVSNNNAKDAQASIV